MNAELQEIEAALARVSPGALPPGMVERIEAGLAADVDASDAAELKVVPFPGEATAETVVERPGPSWTWLAVAAVAVIGAMVALFVPHEGSGDPVVVSSQRWQGAVPMPVVTERTAGPGSAAVPAMKSRVGGIRDEGVVWSAANRPMRKVRVIYLDQVRARDVHGRMIEATVPRVQYILVPERVD